MKKKFTIIAIIALFLSANVSAQDSGFGVGLIFGNPTGLSLKMWTGESTALDAGVAWNFTNDWLLVQADFLIHNYNLISVSKGKMPLYYGIGGKVGFANDIAIGARVPIGLDYMFESVPIDIFVEVVPGLLVIPAIDFDLDLGIGVRFFF